MEPKNKVWELTNQEIEEVTFRMGSIEEAQEAKRQAYLDNGGIILNPEALSELYEACKEAFDSLANNYPNSPLAIKVGQAIVKAEGK